jgi:iron complex transport system permease protein
MTAFLTALATTFLVYRAATFQGRMETISLILVGVVFNAFAGAMILFFFSISDQREASGVLYWMVGSLDSIELNLVGWSAVISLVGSMALMRLTPALNVLAQGEEVAASLGVKVDTLRIAAFVITSVVVGAVVSTCGMIGFVGLIVPHLFRLLLGSDHRLLVPAAYLGGAAFLVIADFLARNMIWPEEIPVGVLTAFCGGPFFLFLLRRYRRRAFF